MINLQYLQISFFKVFDIRINQQHIVIKDLDIYDRVGYGVAHDEYVPFTIKNGNLKVGTYTSPFSGKLYVEFVKVHFYYIIRVQSKCLIIVTLTTQYNDLAV